MPYLIPRTQNTTLDASGNGQVTFAIDNTNQRWIIDAVTVQTSQAPASTPVPQALVYRNAVTPQALEGGTYNGNFDTASGRVILYEGDTIYVTWSGGIPGSTATAIIHGTFNPAGVPLKDG
jgi:hypothetical protein